ncbi:MULTISPECIES: DUF6894 family protein [Bradyrhizobium]|uniref:DUF6894 domain-containing protein n=1 Tax=Bradyrhizobium brasilense TaxID=1419277 RepID=A0ABY8JLY8_9BRAD|nr:MULTISPECIES: hypothetical protein [Bradyrhizobium]KRQ02287.1 hypothetical protein AOQ73_17865 [Bradyrhizobium pachyrhizi]MCP1829863.1 hypothetical protein [Bradyrhizobium sp. USDA 4545]MCP1848508.1 hypothetical protein [Bradyrhizobium sp. USDA 4541]MCP1922972.1 hypothetical protein [Bradyrhizobium sp. USDA 4532]NLS72411.1 hypothetical protein [Bradyrhizobium brasilense]
MSAFHFAIVNDERVIDATGQPVADRDEAIAVAKRLAIDLAETRQEYLGRGYYISVIGSDAREIHRESIDSAAKSG